MVARVRSTIAVVGSINTDFIIQLERIPRIGETLLGKRFLTAAGGKGANQAVAAARAGGQVSLIACVGEDALGTQAIAGLRRDRIDVAHVRRDRRAASGAALIFVSRKGENSIAVAAGANARLTPAHVTAARAVLRRSKLVLLQLETPLKTVEAAARTAATSKAIVILNPAPARALPTSLLRHVSILTPNESEAEHLTGIRIDSIAAAEQAARALRQRGVQSVVLTLGRRGALIVSRAGTMLIPAFKVKAIDTTAAGDVFNGALAVALCEDLALPQAVHFANAAAAISVTRLGAQPSAPTRRAIDRFINSRR